MNTTEIISKMKISDENVQMAYNANAVIQPFKQMPCVNNPEHESIERISAHDLFSHYTAQIIREDIIYAR